MDASGPIPFRATAAYGVRAPQTAANPGSPAGSRIPVADSSRPAIVDTVDLRTKASDRLNDLVAGTVRSDVNRGLGFDGDPRSRIPAGTPMATRPEVVEGGPMHLYNRQADRIEAATGVALGRTLDVEG